VKSQIYAFEGTATNKCKIEESVNLGKWKWCNIKKNACYFVPLLCQAI
jgi:hypothetical protein